MFAVGVGTLLVAVGLFAVHSNGSDIRELLAGIRAGYLLFGMLIALGLALAGSMIDLPRLKAYAGVVLLATAVGYVTGLALEDYLLVAGLVVLVWGGLILRSFLVRYPIPRDGGFQ